MKRVFLFFAAILSVSSLYFGVLAPSTAMATSTQPEYMSGAPVNNTLIVPIGTLTSNQVQPGTYINEFYKWAIGMAALLALGRIVYGGVIYTLSAGSITSQEGARERIKDAVLGLFLLIIGATILFTINPDIVNIKPIDSSTVKQNLSAAVAYQDKADAKNIQAIDSSGAAAAAQARLAAAPDWYEHCDQAASNIHTAADFATYMKKGTDVARSLQDAGSTREYRYLCYQDAIIIAFTNAKNTMNADDFFNLVTALKQLPPYYEAVDYFTADPFGRQKQTPQAMQFAEATSLSHELSSYAYNQYKYATQPLVQNYPDFNTFKDRVMAIADGGFPASKTVTLALLYAKATDAAAEVSLYSAIVDDLVNNRHLTVKIPSVIIP